MRSRLVLLCLGIMVLLAAGCNMPQRQVIQPTETLPEQIEETAVPTEEPTPLPPQEKIAFIPSDEVPGITENITRALNSVCGETYECRTIKTEEEIGDDTDFVIFAKEPTALSSLTQRYPQTQFPECAPDRSCPAPWLRSPPPAGTQTPSWVLLLYSTP